MLSTDNCKVLWYYRGPKPVFQNVNKKLHQNGYHHHHDYDEQQVVTPQHEEIVNYVSNCMLLHCSEKNWLLIDKFFVLAWNCVCSELDLHANSSDGSSSPRSMYLFQKVVYFG